jgi:hypothetical protein
MCGACVVREFILQNARVRKFETGTVRRFGIVEAFETILRGYCKLNICCISDGNECRMTVS